MTELRVEGLALRYRWPGIGAPLAASSRPVDPANAGADLVAPRLRVPLTALLRIENVRGALAAQQPLEGVLELHLAWQSDTVTIAGESVPLEREPTAALALTFSPIPILQLEVDSFLGRLPGILEGRPPLVSTSPYEPGLIPSCSCMARRRAPRAGPSSSTDCRGTRSSAAASSSGSSVPTRNADRVLGAPACATRSPPR